MLHVETWSQVVVLQRIFVILEELFDWVGENTDDQSVFAGSMPLMANLMLSTGMQTSITTTFLEL